MSQVNAQLQQAMAVCRACGHDLVLRIQQSSGTESGVATDGHVYCSNADGCGYSYTPYPVGPRPESRQRGR